MDLYLRFESFFYDRSGVFEIKIGDQKAKGGPRGTLISPNKVCSPERLPKWGNSFSVVSWECQPALSGRYLAAQGRSSKTVRINEVEVFTGSGTNKEDKMPEDWL